MSQYPPDLVVSTPPEDPQEPADDVVVTDLGTEIVSAMQAAGLLDGARIEANRTRVGTTETYTLATGDIPQRVLGQDPRRVRALLVSNAAFRVYRKGGGSYLTWPANTVLEIKHSDEVWIQADSDGDVQLLSESV